VAGQVSYVIEKGEQVHSIEQAKALVAVQPTSVAPIMEDEEEDEAAEELEVAEEAEEAAAIEDGGELREAGEEDHEGGGLAAEAAPAEGERNGRKRRRRRRGRRGGEGREGEAQAPENGAGPIAAHGEDDREPPAGADAEATTEFGGGEVQGESAADGEKRRRRRGRRGGRRSRHGRDGEASPQASDSASSAEAGMPDLQHDEPQEHTPDQPEPMRELAQSEPGHGGAYRQDHAEPSRERHQPQAAPEPEVAREREPERALTQPEHEPIAPAPPVSAPAAPRRGSTVREPAPTSFSFGGEFSAPTPVAGPEPEQPAPSTGTATEEAARPRRAGWWSKRVLGKG
jgi:ribonuclease E